MPPIRPALLHELDLGHRRAVTLAKAELDHPGVPAAPALEALARAGMAMLDPSQHAALAGVIFDERGGLHPDPVGQSAVRLAELAGVSVPPGTKTLGVRLRGGGSRVSTEKVSNAACPASPTRRSAIASAVAR